MTSDLDIAIYVPSRKRAHNMETINLLLPSAIICVDEREADDYRPFVPKDRLMLHPPMTGLGSVINFMMDNLDAEILVEIDDDFIGVQSNVGAKRFITDPEQIFAIIENAARNTRDLGLTSFCFSRTPNTTVIHPERRPIVPTQSVCGCFGVMGAARHRHYDTTFLGRGDVDWTLRTLLEDRCIYADVRFYFDLGGAFSGRGGNVGLVTPEIWKFTSRTLIERWGRHVSYSGPAFVKKRSVEAISLKVSRTNKAAQK